ncbi:MAG: hypothetical protein IKR81_18460 [Victivallales bacterium]|nr:hypothetical protein [Victivallales bacterium]
MLKKKQKSDLATVLGWNTPKHERYRVGSTTGRRVRSFIVMLSGLILLIALAGLAREFIVFSGN